MNIDYVFYLSQLQSYHTLFYKLWEMGKPVFSTEVDTACVKFNREGDYFEFVFNPDFWNSITEYERLFVICHECIHVLYNHGIRTNVKIDHKTNVALDIVVNHSLFNFFGFSREKLTSKVVLDHLCTVDTVFEKTEHSEYECFEYYFNKLNNNQEYINILINPIDSHENLPGGISSNIFNNLGKSLSDEEKKIISNLFDKHFTLDENATNNSENSQAGNTWLKVSTEPVVKKRKWETVITNWSKKYLNGHQDVEQWARLNRRFQFIQNDLFIPSEMETDSLDETKIEVWFFQDTSGSCYGFINRFFKAAKSLPKDKFDIKMHCFDTRVYETSLESGKLYGFGGTSYSILESYIQVQMAKNKTSYPKAIFVITDGYGTNINPQIPKRWYWFLSTNYRAYIHKECNIFNLKDYE